MSAYPAHTIESAPAQSQPVLRQLQQTFGMIPNIAANHELHRQRDASGARSPVRAIRLARTRGLNPLSSRSSTRKNR